MKKITLIVYCILFCCKSHSQTQNDSYEITGYNIIMTDPNTHKNKAVNGDEIKARIDINTSNKEITIWSSNNILLSYYTINETLSEKWGNNNENCIHYICIDKANNLVDIYMPFTMLFGKKTFFKIILLDKYLFTPFMYELLIAVPLK